MDALVAARKEMQMQKENLPERADIDVLENYCEIVMWKGLKGMDEIIVDGDTLDKIKAFNVIISFGRYLETRKANEKESFNGLDLDEDLKIGKGIEIS